MNVELVENSGALAQPRHDATRVPAPPLDRVGRFGGIVFVVLGMLGFFGAGDVGFEDGAKIAAHFSEHRARILVGFHVAALGMMAFVLWAYWLMKAVDRKDERGDKLGVAIFAAAVMTAAVELGVIALASALAAISKEPVDPATARTLANAYQAFSCADYFPLAAFFWAFGTAARRTGLCAPWVAWAAFALVPLSLVAASPVLGLDMIVALPIFAWIAAANVAVVLRAER
jgi:hypothetical protein